MPILWEYITSASLSGDIVRSDALPTNSVDYIDPEYYDLKPPTREAAFSARGMTQDETEALAASLSARGVVVSITDSTGRAWAGRFRSLSSRVIPGTIYTEAELVIGV